jgi:hypothetical protein
MVDDDEMRKKHLEEMLKIYSSKDISKLKIEQ